MKFLALALALTSAAADFSGIYVSYPIGADDPSRIVDRYEARQEGDTLTFWKSGAQVYGAWAIDGDAIRGLGALNAEITAEVVSKSASGQALKVTWSHGFESVLERTIDGRAPACGVESAANDIICSVGKPSPKANLGPHPEDKRVWGGCFIQDFSGANLIVDASSCPEGYSYQDVGPFKQCTMIPPSLALDADTEQLNACDSACRVTGATVEDLCLRGVDQSTLLAGTNVMINMLVQGANTTADECPYGWRFQADSGNQCLSQPINGKVENGGVTWGPGYTA